MAVGEQNLPETRKMDVAALLAGASVAQCAQHISGEIIANLCRADYSSGVPPAEAQQWSAISSSFLPQLAPIFINVILVCVYFLRNYLKDKSI